MMKKIKFENLPAGSIVLVKKYNLWQRFKAFVQRKSLPYNDCWIDPFGKSIFTFVNTWSTKYDVFTFTPKKPYSKKEMINIIETLLPCARGLDPVEGLLLVNLIRPNTFKGTTLEELLDNNKYYIKNQVK